jgi:hypothetical protein
MENPSSGSRSASSADIQDPFRDPASRDASVFSTESASGSSEPDNALPLAPNNVQNAQQEVGNQSNVDAILPIPPIGSLETHERQESSQNILQPTYNLSTRRPIPPPLDNTPRVLLCGRRWILVTKWGFIAGLLSLK